MSTDPRIDPEDARRAWVEAVMECRWGTARYLEPDLPPATTTTRNSTEASGTRMPVMISGEIM